MVGLAFLWLDTRFVVESEIFVVEGKTLFEIFVFR